ncbi:hypothetical protein B484DRAFT_477773 [Ochromonadaceae sp. CCMP2298]|nr:hypothetical protein B484DRAFT_477773 [Ochromonadaceae sp. CCMP2298]
MSAEVQQRNQEATVYVGNLEERVSEELLWELMVQTGPVVNVHMPKDKVSGKHLGYGFVEFRGEDDAEYAIKTLNMVKVYGKPVKVNKSSQDKKTLEVGANLFIGGLDPDVDEKLLYDTFSAFGGITQTPKIVADAETGLSKGFGFVSFDGFESADLAIECMHGQFLCNRSILVQYAYKKDAPGERHGSQAERILAASQPQKFKPHTLFSGGLGDATSTLNMGLADSNLGMDPMQLYHQQQYQQMQFQQQMEYSQQMGMAGMGMGMPAMGMDYGLSAPMTLSISTREAPPPPSSSRMASRE